MFGSLFLAVCCLLGVYVRVAVYYQAHYLPNTFVNGISCEGMEASELASLLEKELSGYSLRVSGRNCVTGESGTELGVIKAKDIALSYENSLGEAERILKEQNRWKWPWAYIGKNKRTVSVVQGVVFDQERLRSLTDKWPAFYEENMQEPRDACISQYDSESESYGIIPEMRGTRLDTYKALSAMEQKIYEMENALDLEEISCYAEPAVKSTDARLTDTVEKLNLMLGSQITYNWNGNSVVVDAHTIKDLISVTDGVPALDEEKVALLWINRPMPMIPMERRSNSRLHWEWSLLCRENHMAGRRTGREKPKS